MDEIGDHGSCSTRSTLIMLCLSGGWQGEGQKLKWIPLCSNISSHKVIFFQMFLVSFPSWPCKDEWFLPQSWIWNFCQWEDWRHFQFILNDWIPCDWRQSNVFCKKDQLNMYSFQSVRTSRFDIVIEQLTLKKGIISIWIRFCKKMTKL